MDRRKGPPGADSRYQSAVATFEHLLCGGTFTGLSLTPERNFRKNPAQAQFRETWFRNIPGPHLAKRRRCNHKPSERTAEVMRRPVAESEARIGLQ
jgi:hypothetical protein